MDKGEITGGMTNEFMPRSFSNSLLCFVSRDAVIDVLICTSRYYYIDLARSILFNQHTSLPCNV